MFSCSPIDESFTKSDFCGRLHYFDNDSIQIYIMSFLFGSKANHSTVPDKTTALSINLRLQQRSPSKWATFVAAADEKEGKNDFVYYEMNDQKTKAFNRTKTSLPPNARQELYELAPWSVGQCGTTQQMPCALCHTINDLASVLRGERVDIYTALRIDSLAGHTTQG